MTRTRPARAPKKLANAARVEKKLFRHPWLFGTVGDPVSSRMNGEGWAWEIEGAFQARITILESRSRLPRRERPWSWWWHAGVSRGFGRARDLEEAQQGLEESLRRARTRYVQTVATLTRVTEGMR